jgi:hypothetical protein
MRALLCLLPLVLVPTACGGDSTSLDPVAKAATNTASEGTSRIDFTGTSTSAGLTVGLKGGGDFQDMPQRAQLVLAFTSRQGSSTIRELMRGWTIYMISPLFKNQLPGGKAWVKVDLERTGRSAGFDFSSFSAATPGQTLKLLRHTGKVTKVGTQTVDGIEATHYTAVIDPKQIPNSAQVAKLGATYAPVDVWIDGDDHVRKLHLAYTTTTPAGSSDMTLRYSRFGEAVHVTYPDPAVVFDGTALAARSLRGGGSK